jgi:hypothetical protein
VDGQWLGTVAGMRLPSRLLTEALTAVAILVTVVAWNTMLLAVFALALTIVMLWR